MKQQFLEIQQRLGEMFSQTLAALIDFTPKFVGALVVLILGWILARVVGALVERAVRGGLEGVLERTGIATVLERSSMTQTPSAILGRVFFWLIMIVFLMAAADIVGLEAVSSAIYQILGYLPRVVSAAIILAAGIFLGRFAGNLVHSGGAAANLSYAQGLGAVARTSIIVMVAVVTLEQLGVDTQIVRQILSVSVAALMAGLALAFALGARDTIRSILAGHYLRQSLSPGEEVEVSGERGAIEIVGPVSTSFRSGERSWSVPNTKLIDETVRRSRSGGA